MRSLVFFLCVAMFLFNHLYGASLPEEVRRKVLEFGDFDRDIRNYVKERWVTLTYFIDFNGDCVEDVITTSYARTDRLGSGWEFHFYKNGKWVEADQGEKNRYGFNGYISQFYLLKERNENAQVAMVDLKIILNEDKDIEAVVGDELCHLSANAQDTMLYKTETNALVRWLTSPTFESIERLAFDVYAGENLEKQAARYLGGMVPFSAEPVQYALSVAQRQLLIEAYQAGEELTGIRVVLTDADADGRVDAFVSSNEKAIGDIFSWSLYLNTETGWEKATETIIRGHGVIEPEVVARESEFYQVYEIDILSYPNQVPPWPLILRREAVYAYAQPVFYMGFPDRLSAFHLANQIRESDLPPQASIPLQAVLQLFDMRSAFQRLERLSAETLSLEP